MAAAAPQFLLRSATEHRVNPASSFVTAALLCQCGLIALASAQRLDTTSAAAALPLGPERTTAERYEPVFDGLRHMTEVESVAPVRNLTLRRDVIVFHLEEGNLFLATPVAGRTIGAVFVGRGSVSVTPPLAVERVELERLLKDSAVEARISAAAFVFTDSTLAEFKRAEDVNDTTTAEPARHDALKLDAYRIEATIAKGLGFSATATVRLTARRAGVHWARLSLLAELDVDTVREAGGRAVTFFRPNKTSDLWVRFDPAPQAGDTLAVRVVYHGDLIGYNSIVQDMERWAPARARAKLPPGTDRWLFIKSSYSWFPRFGDGFGDGAADVDLTFHAPKRYRLASIGRLVGSSVDGDVATSHWTTVLPADQVCFSLGEFDEFKITDPRIPPVTVHTNSDAHRQLDKFFLALRDELGVSHASVQKFLSQRAPEQDVGADVANSLAFFTRVYGAPLFDRYYAAEIPFSYGQAFPGLMYLPVWTFQAIGDSGYEEILRSHEMAHQWWGSGVEPAGYRDRWLSEGFAEFSGLWYMQIVLHDNEKFFRHLKHWRREIRARRNDAPPIGIGWRAVQLNPRDATLMAYYKGAWVLHMLRNLLIDFRTMSEDAFIATMRDFYRQYRGRRASTRDFQKVVEQHVGMDMSWFFDEWVEGTAIPSYTFSWHAEPTQGGHYTLQLRLRQEDVPQHFMMPVPVKIGFADTSLHAYVRIKVTGPVTEATLDLPAEPKRLELNPLESVLAEMKEEDWN